MEINGVFEGGGVRGIALAGAAAATLDRGYRFHRAVGTSAGALVAALLMAGYDADELREEVAGLRVVETDRPVFGFRLSPDEDQHIHQSIRGPYGLARAVIVSGIRARYSLPRTIEGADQEISVPVRNDLDFDVTSRQATDAFSRAYAAAYDQLAPVPSP